MFFLVSIKVKKTANSVISDEKSKLSTVMWERKKKQSEKEWKMESMQDADKLQHQGATDQIKVFSSGKLVTESFYMVIYHAPIKIKI